MTSVRDTEESSLLETVAMEWLVKTQKAGKVLANAVVICELWRSAIVLYLVAVPSGMYKWSINPFTNPYPVCSHP
jgi:hypothetical protein